MLILGVVFALLTIGLVVPCLVDIVLTPRHHFDLPSKQSWLIVVIGFWAFGAAAWLLLGRRDVRMHRLWDDMASGWAPADDADHGQPTGRLVRSAYPFGS